MTSNEKNQSESVFIDEICRIRLGQLRTGPSNYPAEAEKKLQEIKAKIRLRAATRKSKSGGWIAILEDFEGYMHAYSDDFSTQELAQIAATDALKALRN
jgi:hypothetical protein